MQLRTFPVLIRTTGQLSSNLASARKARPRWWILVELYQPGNWLLPIAALVCGALASGHAAPDAAFWVRLLLGIVLVGPGLAGSFCLINAIFDRELDAINNPARPIPSGQISLNSVIAQLGVLTMGSLIYVHFMEQGLGTRLDSSLGLGTENNEALLVLTAGTLALMFGANMPPLALRRNTWFSGLFLGCVNVTLPWLLGSVMFGALTLSSVLLACGFGIGAIGLVVLIALNQVENDRRVGVRSLAALLGPEMGLVVGALLLDTAVLVAGIFLASSNLQIILPLSVLAIVLGILQATALRRRPVEKWAHSAIILVYCLVMGVVAYACNCPPNLF